MRGDLINNQIVQFKTNVFVDANAPILYVKDTYVDNWSNNDENTTPIYTYVDMYKTYLPNEYKKMDIRGIDSKAPEASANGNVVLKSSADLAKFDLLTYLTENNAYIYADNDSLNENCEVYIVKVVNAMGATLTATDGKYYNLQNAGDYAAVIAVEDEFGNRTDVQIFIQVNA